MRWLPLALVGCASAGSGDQPVDASGGSGGDSGGKQDSGTVVTVDSSMPMIDAPIGPQTRTLTQTTSQMIKGLGSIACASASGSTAHNYYRVFDLPSYGINTAFTVSKVSFQIEHCDKLTAGSGCTTVAVRVGTYTGTPGATLTNANMTILASNANVNVPEVIEVNGVTPGGTVDAPITATIPAGSKLLVEVDAPDGSNNGYLFYMGANDGGESGFGYILAPATGCAITTPTNISSVSTMHPAVHLLMTVTGTY